MISGWIPPSLKCYEEAFVLIEGLCLAVEAYGLGPEVVDLYVETLFPVQGKDQELSDSTFTSSRVLGAGRKGMNTHSSGASGAHIWAEPAHNVKPQAT